MDTTNAFQLLGLAYAAIGLAILVNQAYYRKTIEEYLHSGPVMLLNGFLTLVIGYILLIINNSWAGDAGLIITILGWLAVIKGVYIILAPQSYTKAVRTIKLNNLPVIAFLSLLLGIVMLYFGYLG